jgi:hypothetical protein
MKIFITSDGPKDHSGLLERSGAAIGMADSLIAGIVLSAGGDLLTRNRRHFERVPGLKLAWAPSRTIRHKTDNAYSTPSVSPS